MRMGSFLFVLAITLLPPICSSFVAAPLTPKYRPVRELRASIVEDEKVENSRSILSQLALQESTQTKLSPEQVSQYNEAIEGLPSPPNSLDVDGGWDLLATISPEAEAGNNVDFFDPKSWQNYISGTGPSPFQSLVTGSSRVNGLTQWLNPEDFDNVIQFNIGPINGKLVLKASLETVENNKRVFRFRRGFFLIKAVWGGSITLPYPVPFALLGDNAVGWLDTIGYDEGSGFRAALGNKGTKFIFQKREKSKIPQDVTTASKMYSVPVKEETDEEEKSRNKGLSKRAVVVCPQQFGGKPGDYTTLTTQLRERGHPVYVARMSALDWLSITKSTFTKAYWKGELEPSNALNFYMNAINEAVARIGDDNKEFSILSHSIGGWVARAWLGEVAENNVRARCKCYVSLGTPHAAPPEDSIVSKVDQTRGLLKYINDRWPGAFWEDIKYTCVASTGVSGKLEFALDSALAYASYFALSGQGDVPGDGITPVQGALLEGAESIVLDDIFHADVIPSPISGTNPKLIGTSWYADKLEEWIEAL